MKSKVLLILLVLLEQSYADDNGLYALKDFQYFMPMLADIRSPEFHMRLYRDRAVKFSDDSKTGDNHTFWDVAFGGSFPLLGYNFHYDPTELRMVTKGLAMYLDGSAHMLLDFDTASSDVINTDFRIGGGISGRVSLPQELYFSGRVRFFHESTHIGDEFTLRAVADSSFRRYNVSYEAFEFYGALDRFFLSNFLYLRTYLGARIFTQDGVFEDFRAEDDLGLALKTSDRDEFQFGFEVLTRISLPPDQRCRDGTLKKILVPQYVFFASDFYHRDRYDIALPEKVVSTNIILGVIYGDYFDGRRTVKYALNYYRGVNPHGQFRMFEIDSYFGFDFSLRF